MFSHTTTAYVGRWNVPVRLRVAQQRVFVERIENRLPLKGDPMIVHEKPDLIIIRCVLSAPWINDVVAIEGKTSTAFVPVVKSKLDEFRDAAEGAGLNIVNARKSNLLFLSVEKKLEALAKLKSQADPPIV